jgi:hypothetical protein
MAANEIRFAVGSRDDLRSSVWRLWAKGDDLYLAARSFASQTKISFHRSGICRVALNSISPRPALARWRRGPEIFAGMQHAFCIAVPPSLTQRPLRDRLPDNKPAIFVPPPKPGTKVIFRILISGKWYRRADFLRLPSHKRFEILGCITLNKELAWLICFDDGFSQQEHEFIQGEFDKIQIHVKQGKSVTGLGACAHLFETRKSLAFLTDFQLGEENLVFRP